MIYLNLSLRFIKPLAQGHTVGSAGLLGSRARKTEATASELKPACKCPICSKSRLPVLAHPLATSRDGLLPMQLRDLLPSSNPGCCWTGDLASGFLTLCRKDFHNRSAGDYVSMFIKAGAIKQERV